MNQTRPDLKPLSLFTSALGNRINAETAKALIRKYMLQRQTARQDDDLIWYENLRSGVAMWVRYLTVDTVFLYGGDKEGFAQFQGELLEMLTMDSTKGEVREKLGEPHKAGKPNEYSKGGWDKYQFESYYIHFSYKPPSQKIDLFTIDLAARENDK